MLLGVPPFMDIHSDSHCIFLQRKHFDSGLLGLSLVFLEDSIQDPYLSNELSPSFWVLMAALGKVALSSCGKIGLTL